MSAARVAASKSGARSAAGMSARAAGTFLGFDSSTQGLKVVAVDEDLRITYSKSLNYDKDLPKYGTVGGVYADDAIPGRVRQPTMMLVEAFDEIIRRMKADAFDFAGVRAVCGSAQQHGAVILAAGADRSMRKANAAGSSLAASARSTLASLESPIWMDSSNTATCEALGAAVGSPERVAELTGSRFYERFTLPQVAHLLSTRQVPCRVPEVTEGARLLSGYMASLLAGQLVATDVSDAAGMNAMNLQSCEWDADVLGAFAAHTGMAPAVAAGFFGDLCAPCSVVGTAGGSFRAASGVWEDCRVVSWTGDNPSSVAGLRLDGPGDLAVSLGTSDTLFGIAPSLRTSSLGHVFRSPTSASDFMTMLCFKNGSRTRERVRDAAFRHAGGDPGADEAARWAWFEEQLEAAPRGNGGALAAFVDQPEITPDLPSGDFFLPAGDGASLAPQRSVEALLGSGALTPASAVRAVVEAQALSMRAYGRRLGLDSPRSVKVTGGGSRSRGLLRVVADVMGAPVLVAETPDSAALGAAYRAKFGCAGGGAFGDIGEPASLAVAAEPDMEAHAEYERMADRVPDLHAAIQREH